MTLGGAVIQDDKAYLYADTLFADPVTGDVIGFARKLQASAQFPCGIGLTFCGPPEATSALACLDVADVPTLYARIPEAMARFRNKARRIGYQHPLMRLVVACWDERQGRPRIFVAGDGLEQFGMTPDESAGETPWLFGSELDHRACWNHDSPNNPDSFDPFQGELNVFEQRRATPYRQFGGGPLGVYVGGQLSVLEISPAGVQGYQSYDWDDEVGKQIIQMPSSFR